MKTPVTKIGLEQYDHLPAVDAVLKAWTEAGAHPGWHRRSQYAVAGAMPLLARALKRLARERCDCGMTHSTPTDG